MLFRSKTVGVQWLAVFLGNPGIRYEHTRHNVGFMTADVVAKRCHVRIDRLKYKALTASVSIGGASVLLMKPQTFMNLSGDSVRAAMQFYKIPLDHVLVVSDDVSLPTGRLRIRRDGSAGGHNGLKDVIAKCGGETFPRVKIGIGAPPHPEMDMADWVLSPFRGKDLEEILTVCDRAADALECLISEGVERAMNRYNS
ncbi:MAG: aminoacyl-tRNA hydrolase [Oscillospiraceae bacterium]|jgi:PTH1 family peptidyl-tRNA hydrolase|nr:aminoacyl-tRNA hydrolase [Oscillospiraceae bacterium]